MKTSAPIHRRVVACVSQAMSFELELIGARVVAVHPGPRTHTPSFHLELQSDVERVRIGTTGYTGSGPISAEQQEALLSMLLSTTRQE